MAQTKRYWRWKMAERLTERKHRIKNIAEDPTCDEIEEAYHLVGRLCRLAHDNERNCERDNDVRWQTYHAAKLERIEERWIEREKEIAAEFAKYGCRIDWPGIYPSIYTEDCGDIDIWEMY